MTPVEPPVVLPRWYAHLDTARRLDPTARVSGPSSACSTERLGPVSVFQVDTACEAAFVGPGRSSVAIFDGYLFDRLELLAELGLDDTTTNVQLVGVAYERWGAEFLTHLEGCYLVAVWDAHERQLVLGHDKLGRHPVFYARQPDGLWFGSNVLALASSDHVSSAPNRLSLALGLVRLWPEAEQTFFHAINRLHPGHYLVLKHSGATTVTSHRYWEPIPEDDEPWLPDDQARDAFEPELVRAVTRCMKLGAQGIMLSGGVDSVTIAALATDYTNAQHLPRLVAVSGRSGHHPSGEEQAQTAVVEALGLPHRVSTTIEWRGGADDVELSLQMVPHLPSPTDVWWVGTYSRFYCLNANQGLHTLLTGSGGDNWLGVADDHAADLIRRLRLLALARFMYADVATGGASVSSSVRRLLWVSGLRPHLDSTWARVAPVRKARYHRHKWDTRLPSWLCPDGDLREELLDRLLDRRTPPLTSDGSCPRSYYRHSLRTLNNPFMFHENETAFHMEAQSGLRLLSPYHDPRLVDFFNRISPTLLMEGSRYKGLLRPIVQRRLPRLGLESQRKVYDPATRDRDLDELRAGVDRAWRGQTFAALDELAIVDGRELEREPLGEGLGTFELARRFFLMNAERWVSCHTSHESVR